MTAVQPVHAHRAEKNELFYAVVFRFRCAIRRQIAIHFVIQLRIFFGFSSMRYSGDVKNGVITGKIFFTPRCVRHIDGIDGIRLSEALKVLFKGRAYVTVRARYQHFFHLIPNLYHIFEIVVLYKYYYGYSIS